MQPEPMKQLPAAGAATVLALLTLVACGAGPLAASAPASKASAPAPATAAPTPTPPPPTPAPVVVPDFPVVAYQGDQTFGGHNGHFSAAFDAGQPVVLLYFAGL